MKNTFCLFVFGFLTYSCQLQESNSPILSIENPAGENSSLAYLVTGDDGDLYLSWIEKNADTATLYYSKWVNNRWYVKQKIASGSNWFINWADYPKIAINQFGDILAHYLVKSGGGTYAYDVQVQLYSAQQKQWLQPIVVHEDTTQAEHGFVTIIPHENGNFQVTWLDGRLTMGVNHDHTNAGPMTLRTAQVDRQGIVLNEMELDNRVCDCCQTNGIRFSNGLAFVFRDRSLLETRDIAIARFVENEYQTTGIVFEDNWKLAACPVNGPAIDAIGNNLVVAWFTGANGMNQVKLAFSIDGGEHFLEPCAVDQSSPLGRIDVVIIDKQKAFVTWMDMIENETFIKGRLVNLDGKMGEEMILTKSNKSRGTGFPQLAKKDNTLYLAWTNLVEQSSQIQIAKIKLK